MDENILKKFVGLAMALSPENLHRDGELNPSRAKRQARHLRTEWRKLETLLGHPVSETEVLRLWDQRRL